MRCSKCNRYLGLIQKFCLKCGTAVTAEQKKQRHGCCLTGLIVVLVLIGAQAVYFIFGASSYLKETKALSAIQDNLIDITSAKLIGNSIIAGKKISGWSLENVKTTTETASQKLTNLSVPAVLDNYQQVTIIWANKIAKATQNIQTWRKLGNQPGDFPLELSKRQAQTFFQFSIKAVAFLKKYGADAIKNKDHEAMRQITAKLLVQKHLLNAILYSTESGRITLLATSVYASNQDPTQVPDIGATEDVTCRLCNDTAIHWTAQLRRQYGCDTKCKPQQKITNTQTQPIQGQGNQTQPEKTPNNQDKNNFNNNNLTNNAELESYTYKNSPKRAICIGNNIGGVFCVEDAAQSVNEIAASAIGFADGAKVLSVNQWNNEYKNIDDAFMDDGTIGAPVSNPTATGGHLEGGMGTISAGEPDAPPQPKKSSTKSNQGYMGTPPPVMKPIDFSHSSGGGVSPAPTINLDQDTSAQQTQDPCRWGC